MLKSRLFNFTTLVVLFMFVLSACGARSTAANKVEVFSWWTEGNEAAGLEAMVEVFQKYYPDTEFVNDATTGDARTDPHTMLANRLKDGAPPDSWQGHAGQELIGTYASAEQIEPLNDLYKQEDWLDVMPKMMFPSISQDGTIYSVPVSIHRVNVLWFNPAVLADNSLAVPTTLDEWFTVMDKLAEAGVTPLVIGGQQNQMLLMETILLATLGPEKYNGLWDGSTDWTGVDVTAALQSYQKALTYTSGDPASLSWQDAAQAVVKGDTVFSVMGDWAEVYLRELGHQPDTDYGWAPVPGSVGVFQFTSDSFVLAVAAPHREAALQWLQIAGSKEGQEAFNPVRGSICARTDCDKSFFGEYQQSAMEDWANDTIVGSLTYGAAAKDSWKSEIDAALTAFIEDGNLEAFQSALADACKSSGACK